MTTDELITKIQDKRNKQADIMVDYAQAIFLYLKRDQPFEWHAINYAIIKRWSRSGLKRIKRAAWKQLETKWIS